MICFLYLHMNYNNGSYPLVGCKYEILLNVSTESHIKQKKKSREQLGRLCSSPEQWRGICKVFHTVMNAELLWSCQSSASPTSGAASALGCKKKNKKKIEVNIVTQYQICISNKCSWIQGACSSGRPIPRCLIIIFLNSLQKIPYSRPGNNKFLHNSTGPINKKLIKLPVAGLYPSLHWLGELNEVIMRRKWFHSFLAWCVMGREIQVFSEAATIQPNSSFRVGLYHRNNLLLGPQVIWLSGLWKQSKLFIHYSRVCQNNTNKGCQTSWSLAFEGNGQITPTKGVKPIHIVGREVERL